MLDAPAHLESAGERALRQRGFVVGEVGLAPSLCGIGLSRAW
jgi:hypothetical protein